MQMLKMVGCFKYKKYWVKHHINTQSIKLLSRALLIYIFSSQQISAQLNVTLSGGGAKTLAHIGMLKLLEDHNVKIDNMGGSSMGALIGAMYASGYKIDEITSFLTNPKTALASKGVFDQPEYSNFYDINRGEDFLTISISTFKNLLNNIPVSLKSSLPLQFLLIDKFQSINQYINYNYDNLLIPMRITASEVQSKSFKVFNKGDLSEHIRASMSFPIYFKAVELNDGGLYLDGGLYDNLPVQTMIKEFNPKTIIASSVDLHFPKATYDNIISQIITLTTKDFEYQLPDSIKGFILNHQLKNIGTFDFDKTKQIFEMGVENAKQYTDKLEKLKLINTDTNFETRRNDFVKKSHYKIMYKNVSILNEPKKGKVKYFSTLLRPNKKAWTLTEFKDKYVTLFSDDRFKEIDFFIANKAEDSTASLVIKAPILKRISVLSEITSLLGSIGSSIQFDLGIRYNFFINKFLFTNDLFGKFGNFQVALDNNLRIDIPAKIIPSFLQIQFNISKNDFFSWQSSFLKEINPDFLIINKNSLGVNYNIKTSKKSLISGGYDIFNSNIKYYLDGKIQFSGKTTDYTSLKGQNIFLHYDYFNLNNKIFPSSGLKFLLKASYLQSSYTHTYLFLNPFNLATTSPLTTTQNYILEGLFEGYVSSVKHIKFGLGLSFAYSDIKATNDYYHTLVFLPYYAAIPELKNSYNSEFASNSFFAFSPKIVLHPFKNLDLFSLRFESFHLIKNYNLKQDNFNTTTLDEIEIKQRWYKYLVQNFIVSSALVFNNKYFPCSFNINYYNTLNAPTQFSFYFTLGYFFKNNKRLWY